MPNVVVGRTFSKAYGLAGLRAGALVGAAGDARAAPPGVPPYSVNVAAAVALPAAFDDRAYYDWYLDQVARIEGAALRRLRSRSASRTGRAPRTSCSRAFGDGPRARRRRRSPRAASTSAIDRASRAAPAACASPPASSSTRARCIAALEEVLCAAAVIDRRTTETQIALRLDARRHGPLRRPHRHPVPRSHAGAGRAARRVRPDARRRRATSTSTSTTPSRTRHRARRGGRRRRSAIAARHQPRRLLRDADGRDAGGRGDRSRRPAARRRRSAG